jgi:hypothetical protein
MKPIQHRRGNYLAFNLVGKPGSWLIEFGRNPLFNALMGTMLIVVLNLCSDDAFKMILVEDEKVIKTFPFH